MTFPHINVNNSWINNENIVITYQHIETLIKIDKEKFKYYWKKNNIMVE